MSFVARELERIGRAMADHDSPQFKRLYDIQHALAWALDPSNYASPFTSVMGTEGAPGDCSAECHPAIRCGKSRHQP